MSEKAEDTMWSPISVFTYEYDEFEPWTFQLYDSPDCVGPASYISHSLTKFNIPSAANTDRFFATGSVRIPMGYHMRATSDFTSLVFGLDGQEDM